MAIRFLTSQKIQAGTLTVSTIANLATASNTFLVSDGGLVKYRTGAQVLSDIGGQAALTNPITGTGTLNFVSKFTSTGSTLGDSQIFDNGTNVGIGTTSPGQKLEVIGRTKITQSGDALLINSSNETGSYVTWQKNGSNIGYIGSGHHLWVSPNNIATSLGIRAQTRLDLGIQASIHMTILNTGNVGIGTTAPSFPLSLGTGLGNKIALYDNGAGVGYGFGIQASLLQVFTMSSVDDISFGYGNSAAFNRNVTFKGTGNVGIGTTSPGYKLDVNGIGYSSDSFRAPIFYDSDNTGYYVNPAYLSNFNTVLGTSIQVLSNNPVLILQDPNGSGASQTGYISYVNLSGVETGWVGFGLNSNTDFTVRNTLGRVLLSGTYSEAVGDFRAPIFYDSNSTGFYVDPASTSVLNRLSISLNDATYQSGIAVTNTNTGAQAIAGLSMTSGAYGGSINMFSSGYLDILNQNTTNGAIQFRPRATVSMNIDNVSSTSRVTIGSSNTASHPLRVTQQVSNVSIYADYDIVAYSDQSVKENIRPIENVLDRVNKSRGVLYDRIDSGEKNNIGFIAQELEVEFPELVVTNEDNTKAVKYQNAVAVLFEAVKEQQKQIEELKELVNKLITK